MGIRLFVRLLLPFLMLLQACDGTPFGQRLSESFDSQAGEVSPAVTQADPDDDVSDDNDADARTADSSVSDSSVVAEKEEDQAKVNDNDNDNDNKKSKARVNEVEDSTDNSEPRSTPERTLPYRIMIRLSAADPAAPAEGVTEALRRAGIGFEVETIEKVPVSDLNQPSNLEPKPAS